MPTTRGIRNNNIGNIRISSNNWKGKIPKEQNTDGVFEQFTSLAYGVRALIVLLNNYIKLYGANTITKIITKYAPSNENNTAGYIASVVSQTGIPANQVLDFKNTAQIYSIIKAIAYVENGVQVPNLNSAIVEALQMLGWEEKKKS